MNIQASSKTINSRLSKFAQSSAIPDNTTAPKGETRERKGESIRINLKL